MHIFLIGFMGSGKSYWGRQLADSLGMKFVDLDSELETSQHQSIPAIFEQYGEDHFRMLERQVLEELVTSSDSLLIACGGGTPCFFDNVVFMKKKGTLIWLDPSVETLVKRLTPEKAGRPLISKIPDEALAGFIREKLDQRIPFYRQADLHINEEPFSLETIIQQLKHVN